MNEPIISPWFFYLASRSNVAIAFLGIVLTVGAVIIVAVISSKVFGNEVDNKMVKVGITLLIVSAVLLCVIPDEQTLYKMIIARYATPDNINDFVEKIINAARMISDAT